MNTSNKQQAGNMPMNMISRRSNAHTSRVAFHYGRALLKLAQTYVSLTEAVVEAVQNAIDSNATNIGVVIDKKQRMISVFDNGDGASRALFEEALGSVCNSIKTSDKLGQFGLGLISPLGKCERFTFTSNPRKGGEGYLEWTFETDVIAKQSEQVSVPCRPRNFVFRTGAKVQKPQHAQLVDWRTRVQIKDFVEDREISRIESAESLKDQVIDKFGVKMRRNDVAFSVKIIHEDGSEEKASGKAKLFSGRKLADVVIPDADAGNTIFRMYLAKKTLSGFKGKVHVGEANNDYRFAFSIFAKSVEGLLSDDLLELFRSGVFEGEILTTNAKLHESRKSFVRNDALTGFCTAIESWFKEHGSKHLKEVREQVQGQRIQDLSLRNLRHLETLLDSDAFKHLRELTLDAFKLGSVGSGHHDGRKIVDEQGEASKSVSSVKQGSGGGSGEGGGHANDNPEKERTSHAPFTAVGPDGQKRKLVRGSRGLQIDHVALRTDGPLYVLEPKTGTLFFNVEHPQWLAASNAGDRELMQLQEAGAIMALVHFSLPEEYRKIADMAYQAVVAPLSFLILNSASYNLRARMKSVAKAKEA